MLTIDSGDPIAVAVTEAIHKGDVPALQQLLKENSGLASGAIRDRKGGLRSMLHLVTDWPGYFPNGPAIVSVLIRAGADPNGGVTGSWHRETPLHWAASSDDVDVAAVLIASGAD